MMKKLLDKLRAVPHLFGKIIVFWCVAYGTAASTYALRICSHNGNDPAALMDVVLKFFGVELLALAGKTILGKKQRKDEDNDRPDTDF